MFNDSTGPLAVIGDVEDMTPLDETEFDLDVRVIDALYSTGTLPCDTSDGCGSTCSGSACNSEANSPF